MNKRNFIKKLMLLGLGTSCTPSSFAMPNKLSTSMKDFFSADDASFWASVRKKYDLDPSYINLENGYYCVMPKEIAEAQHQYILTGNRAGAFYMRHQFQSDQTKLIERLSKQIDCRTDELMISRNTTESLDLVISGFPWQKGDEAIMAQEDYGAMLNQFRLVSERYGVVNKIITVPLNPATDEEIVAVYEAAISAKTKLLMLSHIINITGQILPVKKITTMAHRYGVAVLVDGAHSFAHIPTSMQDLGCDFYGTSLHKWLSAPLGSGLLYVRKSTIADLWPLMAEDPLAKDDIRRLSHTGTRPVHSMQAIHTALDFYAWIQPNRKENRLRALQNRWTNQLRGQKNILLNTPEAPHRSCAIANVGIQGLSPARLAEMLFKQYNIFTVAINRPTVKGCRITPNIYTTMQEVDQLADALLEIAQKQ